MRLFSAIAAIALLLAGCGGGEKLKSAERERDRAKTQVSALKRELSKKIDRIDELDNQLDALRDQRDRSDSARISELEEEIDGLIRRLIALDRESPCFEFEDPRGARILRVDVRCEDYFDDRWSS